MHRGGFFNFIYYKFLERAFSNQDAFQHEFQHEFAAQVKTKKFKNALVFQN